MRISKPVRVGRPIFDWKFPAGFCVVIDTRENDALFKKLPKGLHVVRDKLDIGDYSVRGFEHSITIERKNLSDLYMSMGKERANFEKRISKMAGMERAYLLIEGTEDDALSFQPFSQLHPNVVRSYITSIEVKTPVKVHYGFPRKETERWVIDVLLKYYKWKRDE